MRLDTKDIIKKKLLDTQENVWDFQQYAKDVKDHETTCVFNSLQKMKLFMPKSFRKY